MSERQDGAAVSGPYVLTVNLACTCEPSVCESDDLLYHETDCRVLNVPRGSRLLSRVAVGSLEEAHEAAWAAVPAKFCAGTVLDAIRAVPASGGSVDLPDGTQIEVRATTWMDLFNESGLEWLALGLDVRAITDDYEFTDEAKDLVLAAWNAEHGR